MKVQIVVAGLAAIALSGCAADGAQEVYRPYQPSPVYVQPAPQVYVQPAPPVYVRPAPPVYVQPARPIIVRPGPVYVPGRPSYSQRPPYYGRPGDPVVVPGRGPRPLPGVPRCPPDRRFNGERCVPR